MPRNRLWNTIVWAWLLALVPAIATGEELSLRERLQPVPRASGLRIDGYFVWCGSVIKVGTTYHMFASRWPEATRFPDGYRTHSEIVRATASRPEGPYQFQQVVLGKRRADYWDSGMVHGPAIYQVGSEFVLYYNAATEGSRFRQVGMAWAPSITGPWTRSNAALDLGITCDGNNPAACFEADGSVKLVWRDKKLRVYIATAPSFRGPYRMANDNVWPHCAVEDFFFFRHQGKYHILCEDNRGGLTGHERWGAHLISDDGIHPWRKHPDVIVYDHDIPWTDGSVFHAVRRERPWLLIEDGRITCLFNGVYDGHQTWNQPVPLRPPLQLER
jgi:hypothetical protein